MIFIRLYISAWAFIYIFKNPAKRWSPADVVGETLGILHKVRSSLQPLGSPYVSDTTQQWIWQRIIAANFN